MFKYKSRAMAMLCAAFLLAIHPARGISTISAKGAKLYDEDGKQFFVKGVVYSGGDDRLDPLLDSDQCQVDAGLMKSAGVNTIRVYTVDSSKSHDGCMRAFASQGIYVWMDLATASTAFNRIDPEWTRPMYNNWTATLDAFAGYDNVLSFTVGSEVINVEANTTRTAPYIKAAVRDMKAFRNARGYRKIPISYCAVDLERYRALTGNYLACGDDDDAIELYGMNVYAWCGNSSYYKSGYDTLYEQFQDFDVPVLFSETGCKANKTTGKRDFADVETMLGPVFQAVFSGAVIYEWIMDTSDYGLVSYDNSQNTGFPTTLSEYNLMATVFSRADPTGTPMSEYTSFNSAPKCPASNAPRSAWFVDPSQALPTIAGLNIKSVTARTTLTGTHTSAPSRGPTSNTADSSTSTATPDAGHSSLSGGAIAGIVVGVLVCVAVAGVLAWWFLRRRNQAQAVQAEKDHGGDSESRNKAELAADSVGAVIPRQELEDSRRHEVDGSEGYGGRSMQSGSPDSTAKGQSVPTESLRYEMQG